MQGTRVWSLVGELRSHMPRSLGATTREAVAAAKNKQTNNELAMDEGYE